MGTFSRWIVCALLVLVGVGRALELDGVPQCATSCLLDSLKQTSCTQEDTQCLCHDKTYNQVSTACVSSNCTVQDALITKNLTSIACGDPIRNKDALINVSQPILLVFKTIFLSARLIVKATGFGGGWGWDDYIIMVAFATSIGMTAMTFLEQQNGIGRDIWTLMLECISHFLKFFFVFELLYIISLGLIKSSLMSFYARHFPSPNVRLTLQLTQMLNFFLIIAFSAATMLQCQPLSYFWTGWDDTTINDLKEGQCFNINAFGYAHAGLNIALNVWLLVLPLVQLLWMKRLEARHKVAITVMFAMGIGLSAVTVLRLRYLWYVKNTANPTHDYFGVSFLASIEVDAGIVLVCMPAMRLFFIKVLSGLLASARPRSICSTRSTAEDSKKLISKPINKQPLPEGHNWGFPKKHGYYDEHYDDWDCRIEWSGGPRDNPTTPTRSRSNTQTQQMTQSQEEAIRAFNLNLEPPNPFYPHNTRGPSIGGGRPSMDRSLLTPAGWRETLTGWRERRDTRTTARSTWRSTLGWKERRDTTTSRVGEIKIMIDKAILRSESPASQSSSSLRNATSPEPELGVRSEATSRRNEQRPRPGASAGANEGNNGGWI